MVNSVIETDLQIDGNITSSNGNIEVKGRVVGDVTAQAITVQSGGSIEGALSASEIRIEGNLTGSLKCEDLKLVSTSHVQADILAKTMSTENGAKVVGNVKITGTQ